TPGSGSGRDAAHGIAADVRTAPPFWHNARPSSCSVACEPLCPEVMNAAKRLEIFRRFHEDNPHPTTELVYSSPFELLIAVILSAQATDVGVNKATSKLFPEANTPESIYALRYDGLCEYIRTIGLYPTTAKNVLETCRILI